MNSSRPTSNSTSIDQANSLLPIVAKQESSISMGILIGGMLISGLLLFAVLENRRHAATMPATKIPSSNIQSNSQENATLYIPPEPETFGDADLRTRNWSPQNIPQQSMTFDAKNKFSEVKPKSNTITPNQIPSPNFPPINRIPLPPPQFSYTPPPQNSFPNPPQPAVARSSNEPSLIYDRSAEVGLATATSASDDALSRASSSTNVPIIRSTTIANKSTTVTQGTLISAVLETALDSSRAGPVRALVTRDTHGFDGTQILIRRGSQLIGEYQSDISKSQRRAFVLWTRLIMPDGVTISLASPSTDQLGSVGISGKVNTHFFERFGSAFLQSTLQAGVGLASRNSDTSVIIATTGITQNTAGQNKALSDYQPTLHVRQGTLINVMVARDLDFSSTASIR